MIQKININNNNPPHTTKHSKQYSIPIVCSAASPLVAGVSQGPALSGQVRKSCKAGMRSSKKTCTSMFSHFYFEIRRCIWEEVLSPMEKLNHKALFSSLLSSDYFQFPISAVIALLLWFSSDYCLGFGVALVTPANLERWSKWDNICYMLLLLAANTFNPFQINCKKRQNAI